MDNPYRNCEHRCIEHKGEMLCIYDEGCPFVCAENFWDEAEKATLKKVGKLLLSHYDNGSNYFYSRAFRGAIGAFLEGKIPEEGRDDTSK